jgi:Mg2+ and Co2+ transporter CorA
MKNSSFHESVVNKHLRAISEELEKGKVDITARLHSMDLDDLEICTENSILSLLLNQIARDVMPGFPDVATSYTNYFQSLEFNVTDDPAPRYHQEKIRFFLQEVEAVLATLQSQQSVVEVFQQSLEQQRIVDGAILIYNLGVSRQSVVIEDCKSRLGGRIDKFKGLQRRAEDLGEWHRNQMDTHKDRQENAIMVFTIVTIVFLPLSFVSSVFGMNTQDIRNMPYNQWTYWAAGVPLSLLVVFGSLYWAGELSSLGRWLARAVPQSKYTRSYRQQEPGLVDLTRSSQADRMGQRGYEKDLEQLPPPPIRRTTYPRGEA